MNALADLLIQYKALEFGDFTLASGAKSRYYVDVKTAVTNPDSSLGSHRRSRSGTSSISLPVLRSAVCRLRSPFPLPQKNRLRSSEPKRRTTARRASLSGTWWKECPPCGRRHDLGRFGALRNLHAQERRVKADRVVTVVDREQGAKDTLENQGIGLFPLVRVSEIL